MTKQSYCTLVVLCVLAAPLISAGSLEAEDASGADIMNKFVKVWDESAWGPDASRRPGYMRPLDDAGWKVRMTALQSLVRAEPPPVEELKKRLKDGSSPERVLAAQAMGYVQAPACRDALAQAAAGKYLATSFIG